MDRAEWVYKIPRIENDLIFLQYVKKFIAAAKKHRLSLGRERTYYPCSICKNNLLHEDGGVQSHLIRHGFIENYTVWKFHGEGDPSVKGASEQNSSTTSAANERGQHLSSLSAGESVNHDYVNIDELLEDIADNDGDGDCDEHSDFLGPEDAEIFENLANQMDQDDVLFGNLKWLKNFK